MNDEKIILVMPRTIISAAGNETAYIRFSCSPDGKDMTAGRFGCQQYVGFSIKAQEPTGERDLSWMKIIGKAFDGKSGFTAVQIVNFVKALGKCAYIDRGDCAVTQEVRRLLLGGEQYLITFDVEGEQTEVTVRGGDVPVYPGETPQKDSTVQYEYAFSGWEPSLVPAVKNETYRAVFEETTRAYPITWQNYDGQVLETDMVAYGETPVYRGEVPIKEEDERYYYVFSVWEPYVQAVSGAAGYTATFTQVERTYSVKWLVEGTACKEDTLKYGEMPRYTGETPQKESSGKEKYTFSRWEPEASEVVGDAVYTAVFTSEPNYTGLAVEYDDTTPIATNAALGNLGQTVRAVYADGTQTEPLRLGTDYGMVITAPTGGTWTMGVANTVAVTGLVAYDGLSATFTVTVENAYTLQLTQDDGVNTSAIGLKNANDLQTALNNGGTVKLVPGQYPLQPLIATVGWNADEGKELDNVTLNLNGSVLTSTLRKYQKGGLIALRGKNPTIRGGDKAPTISKVLSPAQGGTRLAVTGGGLCGLFDTPDDLNDPRRDFNIDIDGGQAADTGKEYKYWELESLVSLVPYGYTNATVENLDLHNCWGYSICERGKGWFNRTIIYSIKDKIVEKTDDNGTYCEFVSDPIPATKPRVQDNAELNEYDKLCVGFSGYFRIVSDQEIEYTFENGNGEVTTTTEVPQTLVDIPSDAETVFVKLRWQKDKASVVAMLDSAQADSIVVYFSKTHTGGLTVINCSTHHNGSLGMVGAVTGKTIAKDCESWRQGNPYDVPTNEDKEKRGQTGESIESLGGTIGFIDIEDSPSPFVELDHCYSHDELHFALLGAYNVKVTNCSGADVVIYRGWGADISTDEGAVIVDKSGVPVSAGIYTRGVGTSQASVTTPVNVCNCYMGIFTSVHAPANVVGEKCVFEQVSRRSHITANSNDNFNGFRVGKNIFNYDFSRANMFFGDIIGDWDAELNVHFDGTYAPSVSYLLSQGKLETAANTSLGVNFTCEEGPMYASNPIMVTGDCYGLRSNVPILPNGYTIFDSMFYTDFRLPFAWLNISSGTFDTCTFNTEKRSFISPTGQSVTSCDLTFANCTIYNANNFLFGATGNASWGDGVVLTFKNCGIADTNKLCVSSGNPTINLIDCWPIQSD